MKIRTMNYYMAEAFTSFRRNSFMSIASIATVALALFILGLFSMLAANLDYWVVRIRYPHRTKLPLTIPSRLNRQRFQ